MEKSHIAVTCPLEREDRAALGEILGNSVSIDYLKGLSKKERGEALSRADVLFSFNMPGELAPDEYRLLGRVGMIQLLSAGADHQPFGKIPPDVVIASNTGAYADPMAEHVLAMILALAKSLCRKHGELARGEFDQSGLNRRLRGMQCGILGFGGIGKAVARLLRPFGVSIHALNTSGRTDEPLDFIGTLGDLERVLKTSDIVVFSLPLNEETLRLIGRRELGWMKPDAILINVARGEIIDEGALYEHLKSHPEFLAGIDVWWVEPLRYGEFRVHHPFFELPNVLGSPHNSAIVPGAIHEAVKKAVANIRRFLDGRPVSGVVNREEYESEREKPGMVDF
ncbi:MAG TPA: 2-hydroxyacid dehydrogenase [Dissulfurispiraceae bacterium]